MKVTIACNFPADDRLGSAKIALREADELEELGVHVERVFQDALSAPRAGRAGDLTSPGRVALALWKRAGASDVVDVAGWDGWAYAPLARAARRRQAVVARSNGLWTRVLETEPPTGSALKKLGSSLFQSAVHCRWEAASLRRAHWARTLSSPDREDIAARGWKPLERISVVNPAADDIFDSDVPFERRSGVVFMGSWLRRKGRRASAAALSRLLGARPDLEVHVLGTGFPPDQVRSDFDEAVRSRVSVLATGTPNELAKATSSAAVLLFPTLYEGFGLVVLEAMRAGLAVVTTPTGAGVDAVRDGETGLIVPPDDDRAAERAVARLLDDDALRRRIADAGRDEARRRTWRRSGTELLACYEDALRAVRNGVG
jgi:glycosyltransferase involved in cell wall biosynthesis